MSKWLPVISGATLVVAGAITFWLPVPLGIPLLMAGMPLLVKHSPRAQRWTARFLRAHPALARRLNPDSKRDTACRK